MSVEATPRADGRDAPDRDVVDRDVVDPVRVTHLLRDALEAAFAPAGGFGGLSAAWPRGPLLDSVTTLLVRDERGRPRGVVQCSASRAAGADDLVRREVERGAAARAALDPRLADAVLEPLAVLDDGDRTYAAYPLCKGLPVARWRWVAARARLRGPLLDWLFEATRLTRHEPSPDEVARDFVRPLEALARDPRLSAELRAGARTALVRLESGRWRPSLTLSHGDLWRGNVLRWPAAPWWRRRPPALPFVLIDWRGSRVRGHGLRDLLHLGDSLRAPARLLRRELERHCWVRGCAIDDARGHLLAGLGAAGLDLGCFEPRQWVLGAEAAWAQLAEVLEG
ncbi:MAG: hypothetical protein M9894_05790 [Planctomycetes bacterium]|nr:hypothetical protein [Planctomycetota bacterium]